MRIPFTKAHGAKNDFLLTWEAQAPAAHLSAIAEAICDRHSGVGADGWLLVRQGENGAHGGIRLFNPDGGEVEISGNGTRCAAAFLINGGHAQDAVHIATGAGVKHLQLRSRDGKRFVFEMDMGLPQVADGDLHYSLALGEGYTPVAILDVGNPQCAVFVDHFDFDWRTMGRAIEWHAHFPKRTNVSFIKVLDRKTLDVRFFERGAGETFSSGTGSTGAFAAARLRGLVDDQVTVKTPAGPLELNWKESIFLVGPAELIAEGDFLFQP
ncbi:MAG: diaminopimelate epimerase [Bryobacteraceae bacterium]|nr:diaminopimelate epimerase [Bryobacteraceae bacterium]